MSHPIVFHHPLENIAALLLAKGIIDVFTFTCCFNYYFKVRWSNNGSWHIMTVRQMSPNSPSSKLPFLYLHYRLYCLPLSVPSPPLLLSYCLAPCFLMLLLEQVPSCVVECTKLSLCFSPVPIQQRK